MREKLSNLMRVFRSYTAKPALQESEYPLFEGRVMLTGGTLGFRAGPLILTNRRLLWYEPVATKPLKPISGEVDLCDVVSVDKGTLFDFIGGGRRIRLRLRGGKDKCLIETGGKLDEWIVAIRAAAANAQRSEDS